MDHKFYTQLTNQAIQNISLSREDCQLILTSSEVELLPLLHAAYETRKKNFGKTVRVHIINNGQNGFCPEDCHYCAQAKSSKADIHEYPIKSDEEFLNEAKLAYERGAYRYCMVFAGRGPSDRRVERLAQLIQKIKSRYPLEICISTGLLDQQKACKLKEAGLDRLNHNLNTSEKHYPNICTTHTYQDRINTLKAARQSGIQLCSGVIIGMNETIIDLINVALTLRDMNVESIPVNFFIPIEGTTLNPSHQLTPDFCLRVLCLFRFLNPKSEIRIAAGRELHLRSMEVMALYPANSLFLDGYLNTKGEERIRTLEMIRDAGFSIESDYSTQEIIDKELFSATHSRHNSKTKPTIKNLEELRPAAIVHPQN